ncbi:MAG: uroporphyrinogen-III synthase [Gemmatimonadota bacterium]|nr:uroporphyrinogen-III synthase [Gemmatimonadota bacterium]
MKKRILSGSGEIPILAGRGVAVTRDEGSTGILTTNLKQRGAKVYHWPTIAEVPMEDTGPLAEALSRISEFDWVIFSSHRAVAPVVSRVGSLPDGVNVAAVGERTASTLLQSGWSVHAVPEVFDGQHVVHRLKDVGVGKDTHVLFPAGNLARDTIPEGLQEMGATVERVTAYKIDNVRLDSMLVEDLTFSGVVEAITFASSGTVNSFVRSLDRERAVKVLNRLVVAVIGQSTRNTANELGIRNIYTAHPSTFAGLVQAVVGGLLRKDRAK